jgi:hypothetical protein
MSFLPSIILTLLTWFYIKIPTSSFIGSIDLVYSTTFIKCLYKAWRVSDQECVFMVSFVPESLPCFDWILELGQCVIFSCFCFFSFLLLLNCIVIISLICSNNSKTLFFFLLPFYCLAFDFSSWLPFWYLQTFLNSILSRRFPRLIYNEFYSIMIYLVFVDILDLFFLVFIYFTVSESWNHYIDEDILRFCLFCLDSLVVLLPNTFNDVFPIFQYWTYLMKFIPETRREH